MHHISRVFFFACSNFVIFKVFVFIFINLGQYGKEKSETLLLLQISY